MTTMVRLAERDGLVVRESDPEDARAVKVRLSDRAHQFAPVAERVLNRLEERVAAILGKPGQRRLRETLAELADL
jgi:DNA-binding MarR family transcriptional regulator